MDDLNIKDDLIRLGQPASPEAVPRDESWICGILSTSAGDIPFVRTTLLRSDILGSYKARWGIGRMNFRILPGLYAVGKPDQTAPVFVSANYKMSFDRLRSSLAGIDSWIMVIDTKGINVWCAAGKGTFGTDEIIKRIQLTKLTQLVSHRKLILPQLGAPGVAAHIVKEITGFRVIYGPIRSDDIHSFLENGMKANPEMRKIRFKLRDRAVLIPNDFIQSLKYLIPAMAALFLISGFGPNIYSLDRMISKGIVNAGILFSGYFVGMTFPFILLPWLPGRTFSLKGFWVGAGYSALIIYILNANGYSLTIITAWILILISLISFISMNFTGSSTYTSLSGVKKEMKTAVPLQILAAVSGLILLIIGLFTGIKT